MLDEIAVVAGRLDDPVAVGIVQSIADYLTARTRRPAFRWVGFVDTHDLVIICVAARVETVSEADALPSARLFRRLTGVARAYELHALPLLDDPDPVHGITRLRITRTVPTAAPRRGIEETAAYLGLSKKTLYGWRCDRSGPPSHRIGGCVRYRPTRCARGAVNTRRRQPREDLAWQGHLCRSVRGD